MVLPLSYKIWGYTPSIFALIWFVSILYIVFQSFKTIRQNIINGKQNLASKIALEFIAIILLHFVFWYFGWGRGDELYSGYQIIEVK